MNAVKESTDTNETQTEDGLTRLRPASPARFVTNRFLTLNFRYPVSQYIHIRCLKRPFTLKTLKELLSTYGAVIGDVWLDDIKAFYFIL